MPSIFALYASFVPSGDQAGQVLCRVFFVRQMGWGLTFLPESGASIRKILGVPSLSETKAIFLPSGLKVGEA